MAGAVMCSPIDPQPVTIRRPEQNRTTMVMNVVHNIIVIVMIDA